MFFFSSSSLLELLHKWIVESLYGSLYEVTMIPSREFFFEIGVLYTTTENIWARTPTPDAEPTIPSLPEVIPENSIILPLAQAMFCVKDMGFDDRKANNDDVEYVYIVVFLCPDGQIRAHRSPHHSFDVFDKEPFRIYEPILPRPFKKIE